MTKKPRRDDIPAIPDTPENIARAIMQGPPKKEWDYLKGEPESDSDANEE